MNTDETTKFLSGQRLSFLNADRCSSVVAFCALARYSLASELPLIEKQVGRNFQSSEAIFSPVKSHVRNCRILRNAPRAGAQTIGGDDARVAASRARRRGPRPLGRCGPRNSG